MSLSRSFGPALLVALTAGCSEEPSAPVTAANADSDATSTSDVATAALDGSASETAEQDTNPPPADPPVIRRLTRRELIATLETVVPKAAMPAVKAELWRIPEDITRDGFDTMDDRVGTDHVEGWFRVAEVAAKGIGERLTPVLVAKAQCDTPTACVEALANGVGAPAFRRLLTPEELAWLQTEFDTTRKDASTVAGEGVDTLPVGVEAVAFAILSSPEFIYRLELDNPPESGATTAIISDTELAGRMALTLSGRPPSAELLAHAALGFSDDGVVMDAAALLLGTSQARELAWTFFSGWLALGSIPELQYPDEFFLMDNLPGLRTAMLDELRLLLLSHTFDLASGYSELMTTTTGYFVNATQASLYGVTTTATKGTRLDLDPILRSGMLTRSALLVQLGQYTSPVRRGAFVKRRLLCEDIALPPASAVEPEKRVTPAQDPDKTSRQRWTEATSPATCNGCHESFNPFGFVMERYDSLGRYRQTEYTASVLSAGGKNLPIDDLDDIFLDGTSISVRGVTGLGAALSTSPSARRCLAKQWFRFALGRRETPDDTDSIDALATALEADGIAAMMVRTVSTRAFRERAVPPSDEAAP